MLCGFCKNTLLLKLSIEQSLFVPICSWASKSLFPFQFTLWRGALSQKTLSDFNSAEATEAQQGLVDSPFLGGRMRPIQLLKGKLGCGFWWARNQRILGYFGLQGT